MQVTRRSGRIVGMVLGAVLVTATALAGSGAAGAVTPGHQPRTAEALSVLGHPRLGPWLVPGRGFRSWPAPGRVPAPPGRVPAPSGNGVSVPHPGSNSALVAVFCPSATSCWALGGYRSANGAGLDQALRWNGSKWAQVAVPSPGGTAAQDFSNLLAGRCTAPDDCWAVGDYGKAGSTLDMVLHWNGTKWSKVAAPSPGGTGPSAVSELFDVACRSSANCWAAGEYGLDGGSILAIRNNVLHWNGTKWSKVIVPNPAGIDNGDSNVLTSIRCPSNNDCWAVGSVASGGLGQLNEALHWDGATWSPATVPDPAGTGADDSNVLESLSCTSSANCWAAGFSANVTEPAATNQILHWDGTAWTVASTPQPGGTAAGDTNALSGTTCTSADDCWAVGIYRVNSGGASFGLNQALHWDGATWSQVATPNPGGTTAGANSELFAVHCAAPALCWAVGFSNTSTGPQLSQALRWTGTGWVTG